MNSLTKFDYYASKFFGPVTDFWTFKRAPKKSYLLNELICEQYVHQREVYLWEQVQDFILKLYESE